MTDYVVEIKKDSPLDEYVAKITFSGRGISPQNALDELNKAINTSIGMLHKTKITPSASMPSNDSK